MLGVSWGLDELSDTLRVRWPAAPAPAPEVATAENETPRVDAGDRVHAYMCTTSGGVHPIRASRQEYATGPRQTCANPRKL